MPSFGVKNILRKGIVTYDVFFNTSEDIVDYLIIKCLSSTIHIYQVKTYDML